MEVTRLRAGGIDAVREYASLGSLRRFSVDIVAWIVCVVK